MVIDDLPPGDYELYLKDTRHVISLRVTAGVHNAEKDFLLSRHRNLETANLQPLHIKDVQVRGKKATVKLGNANPFTRVHVFATRYQPRFPVFDILNVAASKPPYSNVLRVCGLNCSCGTV